MTILKKIYAYSLLLLNFSAIFMLVGCGNDPDESLHDENTKNIEIIKTVLEKTLNAPDKVLLSKLFDEDNATIIIQDSQTTIDSPEDGKSDLDNYLQDTYGEYFTDYGYEKFFITSGEGFNYSVYAERADYTIVSNEIAVVQDEEDRQRYEFDATVSYTNELQEEHKALLNGRVEMENGKINSFNINDDDGLLRQMMSKP